MFLAFVGCYPILSGCASSREATNWKVLQESNYGGEFSYDAGSMKHTSDSVITVWAANDSGKFLYELDCKNKKARILQGPGGPTDWFVIANNSGDELLYHAVCK